MVASTHLRVIIANVLLTAINPVVVSAEMLESVDSLVVVDSLGERVGKVVDIYDGGFPEVSFKVGSRVFVLRVLKTQFRGE